MRLRTETMPRPFTSKVGRRAPQPIWPGGPGAFEDLIVICAANHYDGIKLADQHLAEQLSKLAPVLYVDPPLSWLTPLRQRKTAPIGGSRLRIQGPRLARLTPLVQPCPSRKALTGITTALIRRHIRAAIARLGGRGVTALISAWPHYQIFDSCQENVGIYWAQDDFVGGAALLGFDAEQLDICERDVAAAANLLVAANPVVAETWRTRGREVFLIPFGADVDTYTRVDQVPPPHDVGLESPIVGFVGQINSRTDLQLLEEIVNRNHSLLLVGPRDPAFEARRFDALLQRPNVAWVGPKPFSALPSYFRLIDVGIVPYADSPFNRGSFPLKTLEYLAAGRPVVATDLPAIRWLATDLIAIASEPSAFADHVDRMLAEAKPPALMARRREFAAQHSWASRAAEFYELIRSYHPSPEGLEKPLPHTAAGHTTRL